MPPLQHTKSRKQSLLLSIPLYARFSRLCLLLGLDVHHYAKVIRENVGARQNAHHHAVFGSIDRSAIYGTDFRASLNLVAFFHFWAPEAAFGRFRIFKRSIELRRCTFDLAGDNALGAQHIHQPTALQPAGLPCRFLRRKAAR